MEDNTLRHVLWAWGLLNYGWEPLDVAGRCVAADFWQARSIDIWTVPLEDALRVALEAAHPATGLVLGNFDGAVRVQKARPTTPEDKEAMVVSVLRGRKWHGLGWATSYEEVANLCVGPRPRLFIVKSP